MTGYSIYAEVGGYSNRHAMDLPYTCTRIRGPYRHIETAGAVRDELENAFPEKEWNLKIIEEEMNSKVTSRKRRK